MSLPLPWVERIFEKLTLVYGRTFLDRWAGLDIEAVKADWAHELDGLERKPEAIAYALKNLPAERPPTVLEFRAITYKRPADAAVVIEAPQASPETVAANLLAMAPVRKTPLPDMKDWARRIVARAEQGDKIRPYSLQLARGALRLDLLGA